MGFMASVVEFHDGNNSHWADQKQPSFTSSNYPDNTNWETAAVCMSVDKQEIRKATGRVNATLKCWEFTKTPSYHDNRFQTYRKFPSKRETDVAERAEK